MILLADTAPSTVAGIVTAVTATITALGGLVIALGVLLPQLRKTQTALVEHKDAVIGLAVETQEMHAVINQRQTDLLRYQAALVHELQAREIPVPLDQSLLDVERRRRPTPSAV